MWAQMITMVPNSSREANAAASCKIVHNSECFRMMFTRSVLSGCQGLRTWRASGFARAILNRILTNFISNYLLTLTGRSAPLSSGLFEA
jgi:hypothetical protein